MEELFQVHEFYPHVYPFLDTEAGNGSKKNDVYLNYSLISAGIINHTD